MDGLPRSIASHCLVGGQRTLKATIDCVGIGLHTGAKVRLSLAPADEGTGIRFRRIDLPRAPLIPALFDRVLPSPLCTELAASGAPEVRIGTVEHLMAALAGAGIDNAVVSVDGPELPILDGSAANFLFLIDCAGVALQDAPRLAIEVRRPVRVQQGAASAELHPHDAAGNDALDLAMCIDFAAPAIGRQALSVQLSPESFRSELARARTFALAGDIARLQAAGLGRGGSLDNAVVVDDARVLNPGGLRMPDEFVRHKLLDAVGDLALAGHRIAGRFSGHCSGHALNNRLLRALFADPANWRLVEADSRLVPAPLLLHGERLQAA
jgi:UDP-3-O-[3-hydroxymyristoyl] N-acetylglucosamine deacetylase